jgi:hypothetical protein
MGILFLKAGNEFLYEGIFQAGRGGNGKFYLGRSTFPLGPGVQGTGKTEKSGAKYGAKKSLVEMISDFACSVVHCFLQKKFLGNHIIRGRVSRFQGIKNCVYGLLAVDAAKPPVFRVNNQGGAPVTDPQTTGTGYRHIGHTPVGKFAL